MHVILFGLGLMLSSAGLAAIVFGYRDIEFTIGTTLISAGAIAGTGGLLLIGLAAVVHQLLQLRRAAGIQLPQPEREAELAEPQLAGSAARSVPMPTPAKIPFPPRPTREPARAPDLRAPEPRVSESRASESHLSEPRLEEPTLDTAPDPIFGDMLGQAAAEFPPEPRIEPRAPEIAPRAAPPAAPQIAPQLAMPQRPVEPPMVEDNDEVPLSPRPPAKVPLRHQPAPPLTRVRAEPRSAGGNLNHGNSPTPTPSHASETGAEAADPAVGEREQPPVNFDSLWPAEKRPGRPARESSRATPVAPPAPFVERRGEAARREIVRPEPPRRTEEAAPVRAEAARSEPSRAEPVRAPSGRVEPPALRVEPMPVHAEPSPVRAEPYVPGAEPPALRIESEQPLAASAPAAKPAEPPRAVAILKSGVVDGMAYTLYADGSIEAQLPAGTLRFGSIAELREHIEKNS